MGTLRPRGVSTPPQIEDNPALDSWLQEVKGAIDGLPFSTFSTSDGPNQSAFTAPEGFIGVDIGSSATKFWFKESGSTSTGWSPWDSGKVTDFNLRVSAGVVSGVSAINVFGENIDVDTATDPEDIWEIGGLWPESLISTTSLLTVVSSSASDDGNGSGGTYTGARIVQISGLTSWDHTESSETVQLSGTSQMNSARSYVFVNQLKVVSSGDSSHNQGDIDARPAAASSATIARINADKAVTHMAFCGLSSLDKLYITDWYAVLDSAGQAGVAKVDIVIHENPNTADGTDVIVADLGVDTDASSNFEHQFIPYLKVAGPALVKIEIEEVSGNNTDISAGFDGFLVKNTTVL